MFLFLLLQSLRLLLMPPSEIANYSSNIIPFCHAHFSRHKITKTTQPAAARVPYSSSAASLLMGLLRVASWVSLPPSSPMTRSLFCLDFSLVSVQVSDLLISYQLTIHGMQITYSG